MTNQQPPHVSGTIKALEWSQGTRKDDRKAHCECGIFSVGSDDNGGYFAILRHIDADQQCADIQIGWAETRELAMDDCEYERRARILAEIQPDPQPILDRAPLSPSFSCGDVELTATTDKSGPVDGLEAPTPDPQPVASEPVAAPWDMLRELRRGVNMIHEGLTDPSRPRQAIGEVAAWWLSYADQCLLYAHPATPSSAPASVAEAEAVIRTQGVEWTASAMILHIADVLRSNGKAVLTSDTGDFGRQVLDFAAALRALSEKNK